MSSKFKIKAKKNVGGFYSKNHPPQPESHEDTIAQETQHLENIMQNHQIPDTARGVVAIKVPQNPSALMSHQLNEDDKNTVAKLRSTFDATDITGVMGFGTNAQQRIGAVADRLLSGVKSRDLTLIKDDLTQLVQTAQGYDIDDTRNWFERWVVRKPLDTMKNFVDSFGDVEDQINTVAGKLMEHRTALMVSSESLDDLYTTTLTLYKEFYLLIVALEEEIEVKQTEIDTLTEEMKEHPDDPGYPHMLESLARQRDAMERQKETLHQTQTLAAQDLPTLANMKDVDLQLMNKIQQAITHMIPLWKKKLAMIVEASKSQDAISVMDVVSGFTDTLITEGAVKIRDMTKQGRDHVEKALTSQEALKKVNEIIVQMTMDTLATTEDNRKRRATASVEMNDMQLKLTQTIMDARNRAIRGELTNSANRLALGDKRAQKANVEGFLTAKPAGPVSEPVNEADRNYSMSPSA